MTAVEWIKSKIIEDIRMDDLISGSYSKEQYKLFLLDKIEYALEMEKEQIIDAFIEGHNVCRCVTDNTDEAKECFEEWIKTYKK